MGLTISGLLISSIGDRYLYRFNLAFDNNYITGGMTLELPKVGVSIVEDFSAIGNDGGFLFDYNYSSNKVIVRSPGAGAIAGSTSADTAGVPTGSVVPSTAGTPAGANSSDSGGTPTGANTAASGGTPSGVISAPVFTGDVLAVHTHTVPAFLINSVALPNIIRMYTSFVATVGVFLVGETVTGTVSGHTAVLGTIEVNGITPSDNRFTVTAPTGNFTTGEVITGGTSGATTIITYPLVVAWDVTTTYGAVFNRTIITAASADNTQQLLPVFCIHELHPNTYRLRAGAPSEIAVFYYILETLRSDGWVNLSLQGAITVPTSVSGGTPSGNNSVPTLTGDPLAPHTHVFAGALLAPHSHAFAGAALATHSHTFSGVGMAPHSHTVSGISAGGAPEVPGGTDLSVLLSSVQCEIIGKT